YRRIVRPSSLLVKFPPGSEFAGQHGLVIRREQGDHGRTPDASGENGIGQMAHDIMTLQGGELFALRFSVEYRLNVGYTNYQGFGAWGFSACCYQPRPLRADVGVVEVRHVVALTEIPLHQHFDGIGPPLQAIADKEPA